MSQMDMNDQRRHIPDRLGTPFSRIFASWEMLLLGVAIAIFIANSFASPYFLDAWNLSDATFNFTEKALIAFAMTLLIISGEIDLSVAAIIALSSTAMGAAAQAGVGTPGLVAIGIGTGLVCGAINGGLVAGLKLPSIVVTIGTMSLFRAFPISCSAIRPLAAIRKALPISDRAMSSGSFRSNSCCSFSSRCCLACSYMPPASTPHLCHRQ